MEKDLIVFAILNVVAFILGYFTKPPKGGKGTSGRKKAHLSFYRGSTT